MWLAIIISAILYLRIWVKALWMKSEMHRDDHQKIDNIAKSLRWYPIGEMSSCNNCVMI